MTQRRRPRRSRTQSWAATAAAPGTPFAAAIAERYHLDLSVVSEVVDSTFAFMTLDRDGQIRMDPSSKYALQRLHGMRGRFDIAVACDTDHTATPS